ncbi:MAG: BlaI/MecI/CopY family transcriptional regulator [Niastella sp.]|nr:BlaI/MecI/CopY family transcriptional regulator [Niastella sp.]
MEKLSSSEEQAMQAVWQAGEGTIKVFLELLETPMPYTTLASTIKNLEKKGFIQSKLAGNTYIYKALVTEEAYKQKFMSGFVKNYFSNSYKEMVNFFIKQKKLTPKELKEIIQMIEKGN